MKFVPPLTLTCSMVGSPGFRRITKWSSPAVPVSVTGPGVPGVGTVMGDCDGILLALVVFAGVVAGLRDAFEITA